MHHSVPAPRNDHELGFGGRGGGKNFKNYSDVSFLLPLHPEWVVSSPGIVFAECRFLFPSRSRGSLSVQEVHRKAGFSTAKEEKKV